MRERCPAEAMAVTSEWEELRTRLFRWEDEDEEEEESPKEGDEEEEAEEKEKT